MLAEGKVDSVTGFLFSSYLNLVRLGVPEDDISTILMADHGLKLCGNAVIVNTEFAAVNEDTVKAFLAAVAASWKDAIIAVIFVGQHDLNTVLIAFMISFFPIAVSVSIGLSTLEPEYRDILRAPGA